jgi:hypothetical protein
VEPAQPRFADSGGATSPQAAQEGRPEGAVLAVTDGQSEHLAVPAAADPGGDDDRLGDDLRAVVGLDVGRVEEEVREGGVGERLEQRGEEGAGAQLGDARLDVARLRRQQPCAAAVAVRSPAVGALVATGADGLAGLELDQLLQDEGHRLAHHVLAATGADGIEQLGQCRL